MLKQHRNNDFSMLCKFASIFTETAIWVQGDIFGKEKCSANAKKYYNHRWTKMFFT